MKSYSKVLFKLEKEKFKSKIIKVNRKREKERMKKLERMKKGKTPRMVDSNGNEEFKDRSQKLKEFFQNSVYKVDLDASKLKKKIDKTPHTKQIKKAKTHRNHFLLSQYLSKKSMNSKSQKSVFTSRVSQENTRPKFSQLCDEIDRWDIKRSSRSTKNLKRKLKFDLMMGNWGSKEVTWGGFGMKGPRRGYSERGHGEYGEGKKSDILIQMINKRLKDNIIR